MNWAWNLLYKDNAEVVLNGHEHSYQRFHPLRPDGTVDNVRGIVEYVVGMGGKSHYGGGEVNTRSAFRNTTDYGMFFMTLRESSFDWQFVNEAGAVLDSGSRNCH
jgi:hypothetical protein